MLSNNEDPELDQVQKINPDLQLLLEDPKMFPDHRGCTGNPSQGSGVQEA